MFNLLDGGLVAGPKSRVYLAYLALTPKGSFLATIASVTVGTLVSRVYYFADTEDGKKRWKRRRMSLLSQPMQLRR